MSLRRKLHSAELLFSSRVLKKIWNFNMHIFKEKKSVCCYKRTSHSASVKTKKNHIWGSIQSLWQDVKYYFIFVILFLDVNIVVNTNLYLKISVSAPFFHLPIVLQHHAQGQLSATRKFCCLVTTLVQLTLFDFTKQTADCKGHLWSQSGIKKIVSVPREQGTFARKLEMFHLHFEAVEELVTCWQKRQHFTSCRCQPMRGFENAPWRHFLFLFEYIFE